jgi:hypothetical protein
VCVSLFAWVVMGRGTGATQHKWELCLLMAALAGCICAVGPIMIVSRVFVHTTTADRPRVTNMGSHPDPQELHK